jgi:hypothetical protein
MQLEKEATQTSQQKQIDHDVANHLPDQTKETFTFFTNRNCHLNV